MSIAPPTKYGRIEEGKEASYNGERVMVTRIVLVPVFGVSMPYAILGSSIPDALIAISQLEGIATPEERLDEARELRDRTHALYRAVAWDQRPSCPHCGQAIISDDLPGYQEWTEARRKQEPCAVALVLDGICDEAHAAEATGAGIEMVTLLVTQRRAELNVR